MQMHAWFGNIPILLVNKVISKMISNFKQFDWKLVYNDFKSFLNLLPVTKYVNSEVNSFILLTK